MHILVHVYVKFHQYRFICLGGVTLTGIMDRRMDRQTDRVIVQIEI